MLKICIDAGHGGIDIGGNSINDLEKNVNLDVALYLSSFLENYGISVVMSRINDNYLSLSERCQIANDEKCDLFISIHHNANSGKNEGWEIIHSINNGKGLQFSRILGNEFDKIQKMGRGIYSRPSEIFKNQDYFTVINNTNMPAVITEFCYIDNENDYQNISSAQKREFEAIAIFNAICKYFDININCYSPYDDTFNFLNKNGIILHEKRFDDYIKRGEAFSIFKQILDKINNL